MAQLNDLVVTGKSRFLNEINGKIDWSNILSKPSTFTPTIGNSASTAMAGNTNVNNVTQIATDSTDATYELLFSGTADNTTRTEGVRKSQYATFNPSKQAFTFGSRASGSTVGTNSYAEGKDVTASGYYSHAEGNGTVASGSQGHAEGYMTIANGVNTHAEGFETTVSGTCSHAEGERTIANHASQHVFGEYNIPDPSTATASRRGNYVEIVGNGDVSDPSNARTLDWDGNETLYGSLILKGASSNVELATPSTASNDSADIVFRYGDGSEKARIWTDNDFTRTDSSLNYRCFKADGTSLRSTHLATRKDIQIVSGAKTITTSTTIAYTGISFVVPAYSVASVTVRALFQNSMPHIIGVIPSSTSWGGTCVACNTQTPSTISGVNSHLSTAVNYFNSGSSDITLYIWAKYSGANSNGIQMWGYTQRYDP